MTSRCNLSVMLRRLVLVASLSMIVGCGGGIDSLSVTSTSTVPDTTAAPTPTTSTTTTTPTTTTTIDLTSIDYQALAVLTATSDPVFIEAERQAHGPCGEWHDLAISIGWTEDDWSLMLSRVLYRESRCTPSAYNGQDAGLTQINEVHTKWIEDHGWTHPESMLDPVKNLTFALALYESSGCRPWRYLTC